MQNKNETKQQNTHDTSVQYTWSLVLYRFEEAVEEEERRGSSKMEEMKK